MTRATRWLIGMALAVTALLGVVIALRAPLVERAVTAYLAARGFAGASLAVSRLGLDGAVVEDLALGPGLPGAARIELRYRPADVLGLRLEAVRIDGLRAVVDGRDPGALASLGRLLPPAGERADGGSGVPVARVEVSDARIVLRNVGAAEATLAFHGTADLARSPTLASLEAEALGDFGRMSLSVRAEDLFGRPVLRIEGQGDADLARLPWPERLGPRPRSGTLHLSVSGSLPALSLDGPVLVGLLDDEGSLAVEAVVSGAAWPPYAGSVDADASLTVRTGGGALVVRLERPASLTVLGLLEAARRAVEDADFSLDADLPAASGDGMSRGTVRVSGRLAEDRLDATVLGEAVWVPGAAAEPSVGVAFDVTAGGIALADGRVRSLAWRGDGTLALASGSASLAGPVAVRLDALRAGGLAVNGVAVKGGLAVSGTLGETVTATLREGGAEVSFPPLAGGLRLARPVRLAIPSARLERASDGAVTAEARLLPEGMNATLALPDGRRADIGASVREIDVSLRAAEAVAGRLRLRGGAVRVPAEDILTERIEAVIPFPLVPGGEAAVLSATVSTASGRLAPLAVEGRVTAEDGAFVANGTIGLADGGVRIPVRARVLDAGAGGSVALGPAALEFRPDALQPRAFGSALAAVTRAEGSVELSGTLAFAPDAPLDGEAGITFRDLSVETEQGVVEKLNGAVRLDGLFPPRTARTQALSARRLVAGLPLEAPSLRFRIDSATAGPVVVIERAEGRIAEGVISVDEARIDPSAARNALEVGIEGLSLGGLLRDYAMEGLSGSGTLSGTIPVAFSADGMTIESGTLEAEGGGVLRVAWGTSRDAMMAQGEQVALMVRTLEDFHYSSLRLTIERPADGSLSLRVAMEGRNPAVKDGHPFRFNISLGGDLEEILAAIREGRRVGTSLLRGGFGGAP